LHDVTQAWQPTQTFRSMTSASCLASVSGLAGWVVLFAEVGEHLAGAAEHAWGVRHRRHLREGFLGLFGRRRLDVHAHVVPAGLAGDRVGVADVPVAERQLLP
jgi:hypothetical protein